MTIDNMIAYAEVDEILELLEDKYKDKIPEKVREFFKEERDNEHKIQINPNIPLVEQNLNRETFILLAILNLNYWCDSEEEKQKFLNELDENQKEREKLKEIYNPDNLFKNKENYSSNINKENLQMIEYKKPNFIKRFLGKIAKLLRK